VKTENKYYHRYEYQ